MFYPPAVIEEIRTGNDIVDLVSAYVPLKQRGGTYFGLCPFHNEKTASFSVSPDKQMFYCFGCGASGNSIGFAMQIESFEFPEAIRFLAERIHYSLPERSSPESEKNAVLRERIYEMNRLAARFFYEALTAADNAAAEYLNSRGLGRRIRVKYGLGFADDKWDSLYKHLLASGFDEESIRVSGLITENPKTGLRDKFVNRLMFPIFNAQGKVVGFGGRQLTDFGPKYLNSPDTPVFDKSKNLYGINFARAARVRSLIVVEGYMDVLSLAQAGIDGAVAALGTAFNNEHVNVLKRYAESVTLLFDSDDAGTTAALRALPYLSAGGIRTRVLQVTGAKDPDEYINKFGVKAFRELLNSSVTDVEFQINCIQKKHDLAQTDGRVLFAQETAKLLSGLDSAVEREAYARETSVRTGISLSSITDEIGRLAGGALGTAADQKRTQGVRRTLPGGDKALREAQKELLRLTASDKRVCAAVSALLTPEEMPEPVYGKLLAIICETHKSGRDWYPAEALNNFAEIDEQRKAAEVFAETRALESYDDRRLELSATGALRSIKLHTVNKRIADCDDAELLKNLIESKRIIGSLSINLD